MITEVVFRKYQNRLYAVFPYEVDWNGDCLCYCCGEFIGCNYQFVISKSKPAKTCEYSEMFQTLTNMGYELSLIKKREFKYYISACKTSKPHQVFNYLSSFNNSALLSLH